MLTPKQITHAPDGGWVGNEYSSVDPFSLDCKHLLLVHIDHFELYDGTGKWLSKLPPFISASSEPRWSRTDAHVLYYVSGNELRSFDVRTARSERVRQFAGSQVVKGRGESDISEDGDHLVLSDEKGQVWIYNMRTDQVTNSYLYTQPFNSLYLTPDVGVLMGTVDRGVIVYGVLGWSDARQLAPTISHMDVGRDQNGREILIRTNSADPQPLENCPNGIEKVDIRTGERKCLLLVDWTYAVHISCPGKADWCIVSTFSPTNSKPSQIFKVKYGGGSELLCDTKTVMIKTAEGTSYNPQPKASVAHDGSRLVFSSNSGDASRGPDYCDTFLLMLAEPVKEAPTPQPERPIVVTPDPATELAALRQQLSEAQSWAASRQAFIEQLEDESVRLVGLLTRTEEQKRAAEQRVQMLTDALALMRSDRIDPEQWERVTFPGQVGRQWGYEVLPDEKHVSMNDVNGAGEFSRIRNPKLAGNRYLFRAVEVNGSIGFEMYSATDNTDAWA